MSGVLLLVPPDRQVTGAISTALDLAQAHGDELLAVVVIDADASVRLAGRMIDVGLLPEKITDQLSETLAREHQVRAEALLCEIDERAAARRIRLRTGIESGDPGEVCRRLVASESVDTVILVAEKRSWLTRVLAGGEPLRPRDLGGCEVVVVDED